MSDGNIEPFVYKRWEDSFFVRRMTRADAPTVQRWYSGLCPTSSSDLDICLDIVPPDGHYFFIGERDGEVVASHAKVPVADGIIYGSYWYVEEKYRGKGYASRIKFDVSSKYDVDRIVCQDSHDDLEEINKRRGFETAFKVNLYEGPVGQIEEKSRSTAHFKQMPNDLFEELIAYDNCCFVKAESHFRKKMMEKWTQIQGGKTVVALDNKEKIVGFGCRRPAIADGHHLIGPLYADSYDIAWDLVARLSQDITGTNIWLSIYEPNEEAVRLVGELNLKVNIHMIRMHLNGDPHEINPKVFAITSIDVCGF